MAIIIKDLLYTQTAYPGTSREREDIRVDERGLADRAEAGDQTAAAIIAANQYWDPAEKAREEWVRGEISNAAFVSAQNTLDERIRKLEELRPTASSDMQAVIDASITRWVWANGQL